MSSGGKWPTSWWPTRTGATAEHQPTPHPMPQPYAGQGQAGDGQAGDGRDPLPPGGPRTAWEAAPRAVRPMPAFTAAPPVSQPTVVSAVPLAIGPVTPPMPPAPPPRQRPAGLRIPAAPEQRDLMRAVIGDKLRVPTLLCEFSGCTARYTHPDALGELELRDRALAAGWQYDLIGRLACPACVAHSPAFWVRRPAVPTSHAL